MFKDYNETKILSLFIFAIRRLLNCRVDCYLLNEWYDGYSVLIGKYMYLFKKN